MESVFRQRELGEDSVQLRELNERLETYLQRVSVLEGENAALRDGIEALRAAPGGGRQKRLVGEVEAARREVERGLNEADRAALQRDAALEELRLAAERCRRESGLRAAAERELSERRRWLEEERRVRDGLEGRARRLEQEMRHLEQLQQEEREVLMQEMSQTPVHLPAPAPSPALSSRDLRSCMEEVSQRWSEARDLYRDELTRMERAVTEAGSKQEAAKEETRRNRMRLQELRGEMEALRERRRQVEERLQQQSRVREQETHRLQDTVGELEKDKESLSVKVDQIVEDQRHLLQMKLALSLEVATYRALLDTEAQRIHSAAGTRGLGAALREAEAAFPVGRGLYVEKYSPQVAGNIYRTHSGPVIAAPGWRERMERGPASPDGHGGKAPAAGGDLTEILVNGEMPVEVPRDTGDETEGWTVDEWTLAAVSREDVSREAASVAGGGESAVAEAQLSFHPETEPLAAAAAEMNGELAEEPAIDGVEAQEEKPRSSPLLLAAAARHPEPPPRAKPGAAGLTREPVEGESDSDSLREATDSTASRGEEPLEPAVEPAAPLEERPEPGAGTETPSAEGEDRWLEEEAAAGASGAAQREEAATEPRLDATPGPREHEAAADILPGAGHEAPETEDDRGSGDGAVEEGETETETETGELALEAALPRGRSPVAEASGTEEELTRAVEEGAADPLRTPEPEEGGSEGPGPRYPGDEPPAEDAERTDEEPLTVVVELGPRSEGEVVLREWQSPVCLLAPGSERRDSERESPREEQMPGPEELDTAASVTGEEKNVEPDVPFVNVEDEEPGVEEQEAVPVDPDTAVPVTGEEEPSFRVATEELGDEEQAMEPVEPNTVAPVTGGEQVAVPEEPEKAAPVTGGEQVAVPEEPEKAAPVTGGEQVAVPGEPVINGLSKEPGDEEQAMEPVETDTAAPLTGEELIAAPEEPEKAAPVTGEEKSVETNVPFVNVEAEEPGDEEQAMEPLEPNIAAPVTGEEPIAAAEEAEKAAPVTGKEEGEEAEEPVINGLSKEPGDEEPVTGEEEPSFLVAAKEPGDEEQPIEPVVPNTAVPVTGGEQVAAPVEAEKAAPVTGEEERGEANVPFANVEAEEPGVEEQEAEPEEPGTAAPVTGEEQSIEPVESEAAAPVTGSEEGEEAEEPSFRPAAEEPGIEEQEAVPEEPGTAAPVTGEEQSIEPVESEAAAPVTGEEEGEEAEEPSFRPAAEEPGDEEQAAGPADPDTAAPVTGEEQAIEPVESEAAAPVTGAEQGGEAEEPFASVEPEAPAPVTVEEQAAGPLEPDTAAPVTVEEERGQADEPLFSRATEQPGDEEQMAVSVEPEAPAPVTGAEEGGGDLEEPLFGVAAEEPGDKERETEGSVAAPADADAPTSPLPGNRDREPGGDATERPVSPEREEPVIGELEPGRGGEEWTEEGWTGEGEDSERSQESGQLAEESGEAELIEPEAAASVTGIEHGSEGKGTFFNVAVAEPGVDAPDGVEDLEMGQEELGWGRVEEGAMGGEGVEPEAEGPASGDEMESPSEGPAHERTDSMSGEEDSLQAKTASFAEPALVEDEDEFVPVPADGVELTPGEEGASPTRESGDEEAAPVPAEDEWLGPTWPDVPVPQAAPTCAEEAQRDPPEGADLRALVPPAELREGLGSGEQLRAEWPEDSAPSQADEMQEEAGSWEELVADGEGSGGAEEPVYKEGSDGESPPMGSMGQVFVKTVEDFQATDTPAHHEDSANETAAASSGQELPKDPQTPGNLLPDHGEIPEATHPQSQCGGPGVADREEPRSEEEAEARHGSNVELQLEPPCAWTDGEFPQEREGLTLGGEVDKSGVGRGEACPPWDESEEDSDSVSRMATIDSNGPDPSDVNSGPEGGGTVFGGEELREASPLEASLEAPSPPSTKAVEDEKLSGKGLSSGIAEEGEERGETGSVNLLLSPLPETTARTNWPEEGEEPSPVTPNGHQLNGLHGYCEAPAPAPAPGKSEGSTAEMIAAAYHYWSSEDE